VTRHRPTRHTRQHGFTLLEVLIALIISGIALATVFRAAGENIHASGAAARYQEAVSRARSHLDGTSAMRGFMATLRGAETQVMAAFVCRNAKHLTWDQALTKQVRKAR
jgi:prepilin-type N-terminal cleavage/methylation domain-containing protein